MALVSFPVGQGGELVGGHAPGGLRLVAHDAAVADRTSGLPAPSLRGEATARGGRWRRSVAPLLAAGLLLGVAQGASAQSLRGSSASLDRQVAQARGHDFTRLTGAAQLRRFVDAGLLVHLAGNRDYTLVDVSFPFARPEVRLFVERLSSQYRRACGERLVVTSLTRPLSHQPRNASDRSVHPTGMAIDLRRPAGRCRGWLEAVLLSLEARGVLEATRERRPPHYHVAVYPKPYAAYVSALTAGAAGGSALTAGAAGSGEVAGAAGSGEAARVAGSGEAARVAGGGETVRAVGGSGETPASTAAAVHVVRRGDSLDLIARRHGATVEALRRANGLTSSLIHPGQSLRVPGAERPAGRASGGSGGTPAAVPAAVHVVRRGDSLDLIARRYGATVEGLRRANGLTSSLIHPGQSLRVPGARAAVADAVTLHVVRRGDSLDRIARLYGATIAALRRANGLRSSLIHPGQSLRIPLTR